MPAHLLLDLGGETGAAVEHREEHAADGEVRVEAKPNQLDRLHELGEPLERVVLRLHRHENTVGGGERVHRQRPERGRTVEEDEVVLVGPRRERLGEVALVVVATGELDDRARELGLCRNEVEVLERGVLDELGERSAVEEVVARRSVRAHPEPGRRVGLRVEVDDERTLAGLRKAGGKIDGGRRLTDAALLVRESVDPGHPTVIVAAAPDTADIVDAVKTADVLDEYGDRAAVCLVQFRSFGAPAFSGRIATVRCLGDNVLVRAAAGEPGEGRVLVVDGGGSPHCALLGGNIAALARDNGWAGVVINGCVRDAAELDALGLGVKALGTNPRPSRKDGHGETGVPVAIGQVTFRPGEMLYADEDGVVVVPD